MSSGTKNWFQDLISAIGHLFGSSSETPVIVPVQPVTPVTPVTQPSGGKNMRYAILAGSNFVGTPNQLSGCINDMKNIRKLIEPSGINILADLRDHDMTTANWKAAMQEAAAKAVEGDVIFHAHSHHGCQVQTSDPSEPDGLSECYCPDDFDWSPEHMITDKWMAGLIASLKPGVLWVDWADCCHAADSMRSLWCPGEQPKFIRNQALNNLDVRSLSFSPMVVAGDDRKGVLLAACRSTQTSADARINGESCGAFSHFMLQAIKEKPGANYEDLMLRVTELLGLGGYDQKPELDCPTGVEHHSFARDVLGQ